MGVLPLLAFGLLDSVHKITVHIKGSAKLKIVSNVVLFKKEA